MPPGPKAKPLELLSEKSRNEIQRRRSKQGFDLRKLNQRRSNMSSLDNQKAKLRKTDQWLHADAASRQAQEERVVADWIVVL
jgi:hypothetical protein